MPQTLREHKALFDAIRHQDGDAAGTGGAYRDRQLDTKVKGNHMTARYIAIDWGSTNLRAALSGRPLPDSRQSEAGVTRLNGKISGCGVSRSDDRLA